AAKDAEAIVAEEIDTQEAEKAPPAEAKTSGKTKKAPSRKKAPAQTPAMWRGEFAPATATAHAASAASAIPLAADVASEVAGAVASIVSTIVEEASNAPAAVMSSSPRADATRSGKRKRVETMESRKRRRRILQGESGDDDEAISSDGEDEVPTGEDVNAPVSAPP
ncbi:hypothetical protein PR002_g32006, partial [Phytophthora rubi]